MKAERNTPIFTLTDNQRKWVVDQKKPHEIKRIFNNVGDRHERVIAAGWRRLGKNKRSCRFAYPRAKING